MKRFFAVSEEIKRELENIKTCPAPCEDGTVWVSPLSDSPQKIRCPLVNLSCFYGSGLERKLDEYLNGILLDSEVPSRHIEHFEAYIETPALLWADEWNFGGFLVFVGKSGAGKSFGAAWAVKRFLKNKIPDVLDTATWNRASHMGENSIWTTANRVIRDKDLLLSSRSSRLLVLDDMGKEGDSPTRRADISDIVSARYDATLPTIVTTELTFGDIIAVYGKNTAFKLAEDVQGENPAGMIVDCGGVSLYQDYGGNYDYEENDIK